MKSRNSLCDSNRLSQSDLCSSSEVCAWNMPKEGAFAPQIQIDCNKMVTEMPDLLSTRKMMISAII